MEAAEAIARRRHDGGDTDGRMRWGGRGVSFFLSDFFFLSRARGGGGVKILGAPQQISRDAAGLAG